MFFYPYFKRQVATHPQIYLILNKDFFWRLLVFTSVFLPFSLLWLSILKSYPILVYVEAIVIIKDFIVCVCIYLQMCVSI